MPMGKKGYKMSSIDSGPRTQGGGKRMPGKGMKSNSRMGKKRTMKKSMRK